MGKVKLCDLCGNRLECILTPDVCGITAIDDDTLTGEELPHPTEIEFELTGKFAKLIGNQLLIWIDEKTLGALNAMRTIDPVTKDKGGLLMGFMDPKQGVSLCFLTQLPKEVEALKKGLK